VRLLGSEAEQQRAMWDGTRRLLLLNVPSPVRAVYARLDNATKLSLSRHPHRSPAELFDDCIACAADRIVTDNGGPAWDEPGFARLLADVRRHLPDMTYDIVMVVADILAATHDVQQRMAGPCGAGQPALADISEQLAGLVYPGFVTATGWRRLPDVRRYVRAAERRLAKLPENMSRDRELMDSVRRLQQRYYSMLGRLHGSASPGSPVRQAVRDVRWMLEELRVSYFAQSLRTAYPVSEKRVVRALDELARQLPG
jgi:ATP-dependent helicase HrpA